MSLATPQQAAEWTSLLAEGAADFGTPSYVTRWQPIAGAVARLESLESRARLRCWLSFKTHPLPPLVQRWAGTGRGVEVVSESEFVTARALGCSVDQILINGVAKHAWLHRYPLARLQVHFDSLTELRALLPVAVRASWRVGLRCQVPDECDARDSRFGGQFGMTPAEAVTALTTLRDSGADVRGMHFHVGQRPRRDDAYERAVVHVAKICSDARFTPRYLDMGGGLPAPGATMRALAALGRAIGVADQTFATALEEIWLEHGRFVTETSTALCVRVLDVKARPDSRYLICDGGRTNQALAADRGVHPLLLIPARHGPAAPTTVCGPTCMTDDVLARVPLPDDIGIGDVIAWLDAGAYHLPWETRFSQGHCAVVWCDQGTRTLARERERPESWSRAWTCSPA
jgi:diaminopimelate decarboxylase